MYLLVNSLGVYRHLAAAVLCFIIITLEILLCIIFSIFTYKPFVKTIGFVAKISDFITETVNKGKDNNRVLIRHVDALADQVQKQGSWYVERLVLDFKWLETVVWTTALMAIICN